MPALFSCQQRQYLACVSRHGPIQHGSGWPNPTPSYWSRLPRLLQIFWASMISIRTTLTRSAQLNSTQQSSIERAQRPQCTGRGATTSVQQHCRCRCFQVPSGTRTAVLMRTSRCMSCCARVADATQPAMSAGSQHAGGQDIVHTLHCKYLMLLSAQTTNTTAKITPLLLL